MTERELWAKRQKKREKEQENWWQGNASQRTHYLASGKTTRPHRQREAAPVGDTDKARLLKLAHEVEDGWARDHQ